MKRTGTSLSRPEHYPAGAHMQFDGVSEYVAIDAASSLVAFNDATKTHTIATWFKVPTVTSDAYGDCMWSFSNADSGARYWASVNTTGQVKVLMLADSGTFPIAAVGLANGTGHDDDAWHSLVVTYNGGDTLTTYVDGGSGATVAVGAGTFQATFGSLAVMRFNNNSSSMRYWGGDVASFSMFGRIVDAGERAYLASKTPLRDQRWMRPDVYLWCGDKDSTTDVRNHGSLALTPAMQNAEAADIASGSP